MARALAGAASIRLLGPADADAFLALRREALEAEPLAFGASPGNDGAQDPAFVRARLAAPEENAIFGAFDPGLVGFVGVYRDASRKAAHKVHIWGMYVRPAARGRGIGAALLAAAVERGRSFPGAAQIQLGVSTRAPQALRLYQRHGFESYGREPDALRHAGESAAVHHMQLELAPARRARRVPGSAARAVSLASAAALGLLAGAMLLIALVLVPWWQALDPAAFAAWFRAHAPAIGRVMLPLGAVSAALALLAAGLAARARRPGAHWLVLAAALGLGVGLLYPAYFSRANALLAGGAATPDAVAAELARWRLWHGLRLALGLGAFLAALRGLAARGDAGA